MRVVIAVGTVESVDGCPASPPVGGRAPRLSGCGSDSGNRINPPCGKKRENLSTELSTAESDSQPNPHFDDLNPPRPDMGVTFLAWMKGLGDFSTRNGAYPQIRAGYPQNACLNKSPGRGDSPRCASQVTVNLELTVTYLPQTKVPARQGWAGERSRTRPETPPP